MSSSISSSSPPISRSQGASRFLLRAAVLSVIAVLVPVIAYRTLPVDRYAYMAALKDKEDLLQHIESPRLIIAGGSSSAFGIDSERIEQSLDGRYQVVNSGLHGGLGLRFIVAFVEAHLRPGDVVVLVPEYSLLFGLHDSSLALHEALGEYHGAWRYASTDDDPIEPTIFFQAVQKRFRRAIGLSPPVDHAYLTRQGFNERGDLIAHLDLPSPGVRYRVTFDFRDPPPEVLGTIQDFNHSCREAGARLFLSFGPYPASLMADDPPADEWLERFRAAVDAPVISQPQDYLFADEMFFDTANHLNAQGRNLRTARLIEDLRHALGEPTPEGVSE